MLSLRNAVAWVLPRCSSCSLNLSELEMLSCGNGQSKNSSRSAGGITASCVGHLHGKRRFNGLGWKWHHDSWLRSLSKTNQHLRAASPSPRSGCSTADSAKSFEIARETEAPQ